MRENTDRRRKKRGPVIVAVIVTLCLTPIVYFLLRLAGFIAGVLDGGWLAALPAVYALIFAAVIVGVIRSAVQRSREIDGGEEEEAKKY